MSAERNQVEQWGIFELKLEGPQEGNPFREVTLFAELTCKDKKVEVEGFYDGEGVYILRYMPELQGEWTYKTQSNVEKLNGVEGKFLCVEASASNHGPVKVHNQFHFAYADGTKYFPFGTTCYAWTHQSQALQEQTLKELEKSGFNKIRMCVFPKYYSNNANEPEYYPFEGVAPNNWDFSRFNPAFFRHLEKRIMQLMEMGIEVDLILFHPYDKGHWGFDRMEAQVDESYLKYIIARVGAFRNVWWSMANEYDYMEEKTKHDWDKNIELVAKTDPYNHLLSIHHGDVMYEHWNPHLKPVIYDEVGYEGNLVQRWGRLTPEELVDKFWQAITSGTYMSHGETFTHPEDIIWWSKGGALRGKSPKRIEFLKKIVEESKVDGLEPLDRWWVINGVGKNGQYYLYYFSYEKLKEWKFELPAFKTVDVPMGTKFQVEIIDTWNMTITKVDELYEVTDQDRYNYFCSYNPKVELPGREFMALRIKRVD